MSEPNGAAVEVDAPSPWASEHGRKTASGIVYVFLADALILPTGLVTAGFLTRHLGPEDYGLFTLATVLVSWGEWTIASLFSRATIRFIGAAADWKPVGATVARCYLVGATVVALAFVVAAYPLARLLREPRLAGYLMWAAVDIPLFSLAQAHINVLVGVGGFRLRSLASIGRWTGRLVLMLALVGAGFSVPGAIGGNIGASVIELLLCRRGLRLPLWRRSDFPARRLFGFALPLFVFAMALRLVDKLDLFMLKALGGTATQAGFFGAAQNLSLLPLIFAAAVSTLLLSTMTRLVREGDEQGARRMAADGLRVMVALLPFAAMAAGAAQEIVEAIFGATFAASGPPLSLLIFAGVGMAMMNVANAVLTAAERPMFSVLNAVPLLPLALIGHWIMIPLFGSRGAAAVTAVLALVGAAAAVGIVGRVWSALPPLSTCIRSVVLSAIAFELTRAWETPGTWVAAKLALTTLVVVAGFLVSGELNAGERRLLRTWLSAATAGRAGLP